MVTCARARGSSAPLRLLRAPLARRVRGAAAASRARGSSLAPAAAAQQSPSAEADATNAAARAEEDRVKERAKQRTRKLRRDAKEEAEEELAECKKHIDTVLLEAQQELLATRGVEYLSSAQAPSPQQIAQDLREGMRKSLRRLLPRLTTSFLPALEASMAALLKARPPERDPESADLLAMLAVMRELTVELFESELPPAVKALDAASKARSGPELRRAVVKSGEPGHEVALVAGQLLADMEAPKNGVLNQERLRLLARTCLARQCAREAANRDVLPSQIDAQNLYAHEATVVRELVGVAGFMARDRRRALLMKIIHEGWAGEGAYRDEDADTEMGGNAAPPSSVTAAFDKARKNKAKSKVRSSADRSAEAIAQGKLDEVVEDNQTLERVMEDGSPYQAGGVLENLGTKLESDEAGFAAAQAADAALAARDRRLVRPGRLMDALWEISVQAVGQLRPGSERMDKTLEAMEALMEDTVWCLERISDFEEPSTEPCAGPRAPPLK